LKDVTTIILGGGRGTRLFPLTLKRSKPAVSFMGKFRLIDIPISNCINSGLKRVFVLTQFLSASLHRHIMQTYNFDTFTDGFVDILAAEQTPQGEDWYQGTADAVRATLHHTTYFDAREVLILSGDHLYRMDYRELVAYHRANDAKITLCVFPVDRAEGHRMGLLRVDDTGQVREFVEKPKDPDVVARFTAPDSLFASQGLDVGPDKCLASMGIYVFDQDILPDLLTDTGQTDFGNEVIPAAIARHKTMAFPFADYWRDIGTIGAYYDANISLAQPDSEFPVFQPGWPMYTRTRSLPPSRIVGSDIRDSVVVEGSEITGASISDSIIGVRSNVRAGSVLREVVLSGADYFEGENLLTRRQVRATNPPPLGIGKDCLIERAIIDKNARIGDGVRIEARPGAENSEGEYVWVRDGVTIVPKGAIIPPGTVV
jgi:glucose-1-phosphate adenylyltransferase